MVVINRCGPCPHLGGFRWWGPSLVVSRGCRGKTTSLSSTNDFLLPAIEKYKISSSCEFSFLHVRAHRLNRRERRRFQFLFSVFWVFLFSFLDLPLRRLEEIWLVGTHVRRCPRFVASTHGGGDRAGPKVSWSTNTLSPYSTAEMVAVRFFLTSWVVWAIPYAFSQCGCECPFDSDLQLLWWWFFPLLWLCLERGG